MWRPATRQEAVELLRQHEVVVETFDWVYDDNGSVLVLDDGTKVGVVSRYHDWHDGTEADPPQWYVWEEPK